MTSRKTVRRSATSLLGAFTLVGLAACGQQATPGATEPTSQAPSSSAQAKKVDNPKNVKAVTDACQLLTPSQLADLGAAKSGRAETTMYGEPVCKWSNDNFATSVALNTTTGSGAAEIRKEGKANGTLTQVSGYPALHEAATTIMCRVEVGLSEGQSIAVDYSKHSGDAPAMQDPCGYAEKIAAAAITNIPDA